MNWIDEARRRANLYILTKDVSLTPVLTKSYLQNTDFAQDTQSQRDATIFWFLLLLFSFSVPPSPLLQRHFDVGLN